MSATTVKIGKTPVNLSNLEKVLYPQVGFTKGQVIEYYLKLSSVIVPHVKNRPLTLKRYPNGVDGMMCYEKRCPPHAPPWIKQVTVTSHVGVGTTFEIMLPAAVQVSGEHQPTGPQARSLAAAGATQ